MKQNVSQKQRQSWVSMMKCDVERGFRKSSIEPAPCVLMILSCLLHVAVVAVLVTGGGPLPVVWERAIESVNDP
jgi:carbamate kinase